MDVFQSILFQSIAAMIVGFIVIIWGADRFVTGAAAVARNLGVSPLIIGLTIVGIGTSAPEMLVSLEASLQGTPALAIGNAIGSNITNISLVIGVTALLIPLAVKSDIIKREFPVLFLVTGLAVVLLFDGHLSFYDGLILCTALILLVIWIVFIGIRSNHNDPIGQEFDQEIPEDMSNLSAFFWLLIGVILLVGSSKIIVWGAVEFATYLGISELVIGLTIIAIGTSLPELAASIASVYKNEPDIALGNIIGSNMFNLLAVLFIPGLISQAQVPPEVISRDLYIMIGLTVLFFMMAIGWRGHGRINRFYGFILVLCFIGYQLLLYREKLPAINH